MAKTKMQSIWKEVFEALECSSPEEFSEKYEIPLQIVERWIKGQYGKGGPRLKHLFKVKRELMQRNEELAQRFVEEVIRGKYQPTKKVPRKLELPKVLEDILDCLGVPSFSALPVVLNYKMKSTRPITQQFIAYDFLHRFLEGRTHLFMGFGGRILAQLVALGKKDLAWDFLVEAWRRQNDKRV